MIMTLKTREEGSTTYLPLDTFEDFEVKYNHQFEDYSTIGGRTMPYTSSFKIPTTENNRLLTTVDNDLAFPINKKADGRMLYNDGTVAFEFIADIDGHVTNVLQPYIKISIVDKISYAISEMRKWKLSDMMGSQTFKLGVNTWPFGDQTVLDTIDKYWLFVYLNYNNRNALMSHDPKRDLTQLQPTFILNRLVDKMFNYVGLTINSDFLNLDNQLATGINANELALTIPWKMKTLDDDSLTVNHSFIGNSSNEGVRDRVAGVPSQMPSSQRLRLPNFIENQAQLFNSCKMNYDFYADYTLNGIETPDSWGARYCSTVSGKMNVRVQSNNTPNKQTVSFGRLFSSQNLGVLVHTNVTTVSGTPPALDVKLVNANMLRDTSSGLWWSQIHYNESADSYDIKSAPIVGEAVYTGVVGTSGSKMIEYEINLSNDVTVELDVVANEPIGLAYVLVPKEGQTEAVIDYSMTDPTSGNVFAMQMILKEGYLEYKMITTGGALDENYHDKQTAFYSKPIGADEFPASLTFSFPEVTDLPSGRINYSDSGGQGNLADIFEEKETILQTDVSMAESIKAVKDYSLIDILKMIMERFNLSLYTTSDGQMHLDTEANRASGVNFTIDHLIDEGMEAHYSDNQNGILNIKDTNASFYEEDFNRLDKKVISETARDEVTLSFKSGIVNSKMFVDEYDDSAYDLLAWKGDSNEWGVSDREQKTPSEFKPTFCFLTPNETPVYFPVNRCNYSLYVLPDANDEGEVGLDIGFYNQFYEYINLKTSLKADNVHTNGFKLVSFEKDDYILGTDNLYKQTWHNKIDSKMRDEATTVDFEIYLSEENLSILLDFPTIVYKSQEWDLLGFNGFSLTNHHGGSMVKLMLSKKEVWS